MAAAVAGAALLGKGLDISLAALQQHDPYISSIVDVASQVALYTFGHRANEWVRAAAPPRPLRRGRRGGAERGPAHARGRSVGAGAGGEEAPPFLCVRRSVGRGRARAPLWVRCEGCAEGLPWALAGSSVLGCFVSSPSWVRVCSWLRLSGDCEKPCRA